MRVLKNIYINLFFTLSIGIFQFVINKYFSKFMGMETLGLMRLFTQMIGYLNLADLGISMASAYALYKPLAERDIEKISIIMNTLNIFYKRIINIILVSGSISLFIIPQIIPKTSHGKLIYFYWTIYILNLAFSYSFAKYGTLFTADQNYSYVRRIQGTARLLMLTIQLLILLRLQSFSLFLIAMLIENIFCYFLYYKKYKSNYNYIIKIDKTENGIFKDMKNLFWHKIGGIVVFNTDYIVLSIFTSLEIVAIYSTYLMIYQMITTITGVLSPAISPGVGKYIALNTKDKIYLKWKEIYAIYMFIGTVVAVCSFILFQSFVELWMGKDYLLPKMTLYLILLNLFIQITREATEMFKNNSGFFDDIQAPILESVINLVVSLILVRKIGLNGVIIGTICSNVIVIYFLKPILVFQRCFNLSYKFYIHNLVYNLARVGLVFFIVIILEKHLNISKNIFNWNNFILLSTNMLAVTSILSFIVFLSNNEFRNFSCKFLKK